MSKIYLWCEPCGQGDVIGFAMSEDGKGLVSHLSSNVNFSKHDLGLTSNWKHNIYQAEYPEGFELVWLDDPKNNNDWQNAYELNQKRI